MWYSLSSCLQRVLSSSHFVRSKLVPILHCTSYYFPPPCPNLEFFQSKLRLVVYSTHTHLIQGCSYPERCSSCKLALPEPCSGKCLFQVLLMMTWNSSTYFWDRFLPLAYVVLGIGPRASCMLEKHCGLNSWWFGL